MFRLAYLGVLLVLVAPVAAATDATILEIGGGKLRVGDQSFRAVHAPVGVTVSSSDVEPPGTSSHSSSGARAHPQPQPQGAPQEPARDPVVPFIDFATSTLDGAIGALPVDIDAIPILRNDGPTTPAAAPDADAPAAPLHVGSAPVTAPAAVAVAPTVGLVAVAAVTVVAPAASTFSWDRLRRFGALVGLYTRIAKERLLDHGARERLLHAVLAQPGSSVAEIARAAAIPRNTSVYHLFRLEKEGLVSSLRNGRQRLYFAAASWKERESSAAVAAIRHPVSQRIAAEVGASPGLDQNALCQRFGLAPSLAHWHAKRLESAGVVTRQREGRRVRYYPGEKFALAMASA